MLRIHLSGRFGIEAEGELFGPRVFPGPQGRAAFAYLVGRRGMPVSRAALADALWGERRPPASAAALNALVSKLRGVLGRAGMEGSDVLRGEGGSLELTLPAGTWVDHEVAADAIHEAEAALRDGDHPRAYGPSAVAHHIARRPFLPDVRGEWFDQRRERLTEILTRSIECRAAVYLWNGEHPLALEAASELVALRPFRESGYRLLMRAHAAAGNAAEALRVYEACRFLIAEELGVSPSPETQAAHREVLASL
jgi:SARP family transcriptional regulator, regulator of embCAB operon